MNPPKNEVVLGEIEDNESSFSPGVRHRLVDDFAVSYYNGSIKADLAEKNPTTGKDVEYLMDGHQFEKLDRSEVWSYSTAVGTGYQFRVTYRDKRYSDLVRLLAMYSGRIAVTEEDSPLVEQKLYDLILLMLQEKRLPQNFKIQPVKDPRLDRMIAAADQLARSFDTLEMRVKALEDRLKEREGLPVPGSPQGST